MLPVLLIGILFGLAMDYEVFLVSRMRENFVHTGKARESVVTGFGQSGRVVTAAVVIMTGVFGAFILDDDPIVKSIGLALAFGVIADAFIVRLTLVPLLWPSSAGTHGGSHAVSSGSCPRSTSRVPACPRQRDASDGDTRAVIR